MIFLKRSLLSSSNVWYHRLNIKLSCCTFGWFWGIRHPYICVRSKYCKWNIKRLEKKFGWDRKEKEQDNETG